MKTNPELEKQLRTTFSDLDISAEQQESIYTFTNPLKLKHFPTWEHSVRCGIKGMEVLAYTHLDDPKAGFYVCILHDVGKALTNLESLSKVKGFNEEDMLELNQHVIDGSRLIRGAHEFTSRVILWHHYFSGGYPDKEAMPKTSIDFSEATLLKAMHLGRLTGLVDFHDAATYRENDKFSPGTPRLPTSDEVKGLLLSANKDQTYFIEQLYEAGIF